MVTLGFFNRLRGVSIEVSIMNIKLWITYIFNRRKYIKDLERFDLNDYKNI